MRVEVKVPVLAESVADATVAAWHRQPGEQVRRGDALCDLETDKVTLEVAATEDGVLAEVREAAGSTVVTGQVLAVLEAGATQTTEVTGSASQGAALGTVASGGQASVVAAPVSEARQASEASPTAPRLSPAVRRMVAETGVNPAAVPTATPGRVTKADLVNFLEAGAAATPPATSPVPAPADTSPSDGDEARRRDERVPMTRLRRRAAERLLAAQRESAILTTFNEIDMQPVTALRDRHREAFETRHEAKLGFMSFFVKACVAALRRFPVINASVDGEHIVHHHYYDVGVAVGSPRGLVVPVLRDADQQGFAAIERAIRDFGRRAREGSLSVEDLTGGTFTITNGGVFGSLMSTPILNPPQSAILGMHRVQDRPVAIDGQVCIRPMMYVALSYDHRIIDGREAVQFLVAVKDAIEDPTRLLLEV